MNSHLRRLLGFGLVPALSMLSSILLLPIISLKIGPSGWTAVAVGQSIGAIFSSVVSLAWGVIGGIRSQRVTLWLSDGKFIDQVFTLVA
jgi:hypothetical protein